MEAPGLKEIQTVLIAGAGAVGSAVAARIEDSLPGRVSVLAEGARGERYGREGFEVNGRAYRFPVVSPPPAGSSSSPETGPEPADLILVAVKHHHLPETIRQMAPFVGGETTILSLMNGITSEEMLGQAFGPGPGAPEGSLLPPYGMIIGIDAVRQENRTRFASPGTVFFGEGENLPGEESPRVARISRFFSRTGIRHQVPRDMLRTLWYKFMINVGVNQASALLKAPYRLFQTDPDAREAMETLMREVIALAGARGIGLSGKDLDAWQETLHSLPADSYTSMAQDVLARRKTEVEMLAGTVSELGRQTGVPTPANDFCFRLLRAAEADYL